MAINKVVYGTSTLIDLTSDTVTPSSLTLGATAHGADGNQIVGEYEYVLPLMSADTRGGAKLQASGGLALRDGALGIGSLVQSGTQVTGPIAHATAKGWAEQDADPTPENPQEIRVARGRNLLDESAVTNGKYLASGGTETTDAAYSISDYVPIEVGATYVTSGMGAVSSAYYAWYNSSKTYISATQQTNNGFTLTAPANAAYVRVSLLNASLGTSQLELGSTPTPYVPYGHVGMEVRDPDTDALMSVTAIPLPSKGFAASLPDGTADTLTIDGAGKWEWESETAEVVLDGSSDEDWRYSSVKKFICDSTTTSMKPASSNNSLRMFLASRFVATTYNNAYSNDTGRGNGYAGIGTAGEFGIVVHPLEITTINGLRTWLSANPVTVLYPIATPTTESGYVDMPSIGGEAVVTIPELDELGVDYWVEQSIFEAARDWYERGSSSALTKFASLASGAVAITQGGTGATTAGDARKNLGAPSSSSLATVEQSTATTNHAKDSHFIVDGELKKATAAIASGESITSSNSTDDTLQGQIDTLRDSVAQVTATTDDAGRFRLFVPLSRLICVYVLSTSYYIVPRYLDGDSCLVYLKDITTNTTVANTQATYVYRYKSS